MHLEPPALLLASVVGLNETMRTIGNKIFFGILFLFLSWKGLDGLTINISHSRTVKMDILKLEKNPTLNSRNMHIDNGVSWMEENFIYYESDPYSNVDILYPLISHQQAEEFRRQKRISVSVLVRLKDENRTCILDGSCIPSDSTPIQGLVFDRLEDMPEDEIAVLETPLMKLNKNLIIIEHGNVPLEWYWNMAMFIVGTVFGFTILKSFFRKASSIKEYWNKVTEKNPN